MVTLRSSFFVAASVTCAVLAAPQAFAQETKCHFGGCGPRPSSVVEYFNLETGHYFQTASPEEIAAIARGSAGPGWLRTGVSFQAWHTAEQSRNLGSTCESADDPCRPVQRFYSAKANSHFFTADPAEAAVLLRPGSEWASEGIAFYLPVPDAHGQCRTGTPIYRLYNDRWHLNDGNHRFTPSGSARKYLADRGWVTEGIAFCAYGAGGSTVAEWQWAFAPSEAPPFRTPEGCRSDDSAPDSCIAVRNLPLPSVAYAAVEPIGFDAFNARLGSLALGAINYGYPAVSIQAAAAASFVQLMPRHSIVGIHLNAEGAAPGSYAEISPYRRVKAAAAQGADDARVFPWRPRFGLAQQLFVRYVIGLKSRAAAPGSAAYGALSLEFMDVRSGNRFQFNVLSYGSEPASPGEYIARDVKTGMALVGIGAGVPSRFVSETIPLVTEHTSRYGSERIPESFFMRMTRNQFQALVHAARGADPSLSTDPDDYVLERFGVVNETFGQGQLAVTVTGPFVSHEVVPD